MSYMNFFLQIFSLMAGMPVFILVINFYQKYKKLSIIFYGLFILGIFSFIMNGVILEYFNLLHVQEKPFFIKIINIFFSNLGSVAFFLSGPVLVHILFGLKIKIILPIAGFLALISVISGYFYADLDLYIFFTLTILVTLYMLIICIRNFSSIGDPFLRLSIKVFLILSSINILFLILPLFPPAILYEISTLGISLYFLVINILNIIFCIKFYGQNPYMTDKGISHSFIDRYKITPREVEIINLLMEGYTVNALGDALFISPKTVSNHIHNIYQKTEVNNRIQMINLIKSRS